MENITVAVGGADCGKTPILPYIGERADTTEFTGLSKLYLAAALIRCGADAVIIEKAVKDLQDVVIPVNRQSADAAVVTGLSRFGSGKRFNDMSGGTVHYSVGRVSEKSKLLGEDVCAALLRGAYKNCSVHADGIYGAAGCPAITVNAGYATCFDDAKRIHDPDFAVNFAEHTAMGVCENLGLPYLRRDDLNAYPLFCAGATGKRGRKIKLIQTLLSAEGYEVRQDGIFGKETELAVKKFCINNDLDDCGVTKEFWKTLLALDRRPAEAGKKNVTALYVQRMLRSKLYDAPINGTIDKQTLSALDEFLTEAESNVRVSDSGTIDAETVKLLAERISPRPRLF